MKIEAIYRGNGKTIDNLTVITSDIDVMVGTGAYLGCDEHGGTSFSQWGQMKITDLHRLSKDRTRYIWHRRTHIGTLIHFEDLNSETQKHIAERILL